MIEMIDIEQQQAFISMKFEIEDRDFVCLVYGCFAEHLYEVPLDFD